MSYREIEKELPNEYLRIVLEVVGFVRQEGLNKYSFKKIRDAIYVEAKSYLDKKTPANDELRKQLSQFAAKKVGKGLKKSWIESFSSIVFIVGIILGIGLPIFYGVSFINTEEIDAYSKGIYTYMNYNRLFVTSIYLAVGMFLSSMITKGDPKKKTRIIITVGVVSVTIVGIAFGLSKLFEGQYIRINFPLWESIFIILSAVSYVLEDFVASKTFKKFEEERNVTIAKKD